MFDEPVYYENLEGLAEYDIPQRYWEGRKPGLSAMVRVKNEGDFLAYSVASILDWHDEVCLFVQGKQDDNTLAVAEGLVASHPDKVKLWHYPFESIANGPGHDLQTRGSVYERAYFYNWCLAKTSHEFADKWDGDMVAYDWLGGLIRSAMEKYDGVKFAGLDLAGRDLKHESRKRHTACELRVHRVTENAYYFTHKHCEHISLVAQDSRAMTNVLRLDKLAYLHLKWCKPSLKLSGVGWPDNWLKADDYYRDIYDGKKARRPYIGEYPKALLPYLESIKS